MEKRDKFIGMNSIKFNRYFKTDDDCQQYISEIKWEQGYRCKKCGNTKYIRGSKLYNRRCLKCKKDESPAAGTMFDKVKFSLLTAMNIVFKVVTKKKGMSTLELSREFELRQKTCWTFKWKIQQAMRSSKQNLLKGEVHVDEFYIGQPEVQKRGRSKAKKRLVVIALEKVQYGVGRAYAQTIAGASAEDFKPFFNSFIDRNAIVITDEWRGYLPLKKEYPNLKQLPSNEGKNFPDLHIHIMNLKGWLRGIHHHCSEKHLQGYLDEYHYRYNRRNNMETMFDSLVRKMIINKPVRLTQRDN